MGEFSKPKVLIDREEYEYLLSLTKPDTEAIHVKGIDVKLQTGFIVEATESTSITTLYKPKSILEGKVAIQVGNEREFKLLMKHFKLKKWIPLSGDNTIHVEYETYRPHEVEYKDNFSYMCDSSTPFKTFKDRGYTVITFSDFAAEAGIKVPEFFCKSEDGKDLFVSDKPWVPQRIYNCTENIIWEDSPWKIAILKHFPKNREENTFYFSTQEAAEAWIAEHKVAILISQDGVPLYKGDNCWMAIQNAKQWALASHEDHRVDKHIFTVTDNGVFDPNSPFAKIFATKKEAEKWITEANKPKEVKVKLYNNRTAIVSSDSIIIPKDGETIKLWPSDIEDLSHALKSL
ncbi:hypothetical protein [Sphingobacterium mizutaii]|uniref:hypothetical protein n=1 Tax=Sphingobacterium mizutaii TaxID=1010 RepID=UPI00289C2AB5|nr:hypothetical protein [Sphingobacterium mizutaii]